MNTKIERAVRKQVPTIQHAVSALIAMRQELTAAKIFEEIKTIEQYAEALNVLFAGVDEVKHKAQDVIIEANVRIGEELVKVPKLSGSGRTYTTNNITANDKTTNKPVSCFSKGKGALDSLTCSV